MKPAPCLLLIGLGVGCSAEPLEAHWVRVIVDTDMTAPDEVDAFSLQVEQSGTVQFEQNYDVAAFEKLPDSIVLNRENAIFVSPDNEWNLPLVRVAVIGYKNASPVVWRSAQFRYGNGRAQLPLPMCFDCLGVKCEPGQTCEHGACADDSTSVGGLPEDDVSRPLINALSLCGPR